MIVKRAFKFKLNPTRLQCEMFLRFAGARRFVFNRGLDQRQKAYEVTGKSPSYFEQNKELTSLKEAAETTWLAEIHSQVLQQGLKDLDRAFQNFFRRVKKGEKPGHPKFKKKGMNESFRFPQGVKVEGSKVYLPKIGWIKFRKSREILGEINETTILQEGADWYVSFSSEWKKELPPKAPIDEERSIGIDVGLEHFATTAAGKANRGEEIENPKFLQKRLCHLRYCSRQLSRKTQKSKNRLKARLKLSKLHARIKNLRSDFVQQLSTKMVKNHDIFCIESLDISSLLEKSSKGLSRAISDAGWRSFLHCLKYKIEERGKHLVEMGKYFPSSQICASCGNRQKMPLFVREYNCPNCGIKNGRDYNSAIVLKAAGMSVLKACGAALNGGSVEAGISRL
jgi:putative transposase